MSGHLRRDFLLARLRKADGPAYDELVGAVAGAFPGHNHHAASARAARVVRLLLLHRLAVTAPDESMWLTPEGWKAAEGVKRLPDDLAAVIS